MFVITQAGYVNLDHVASVSDYQNEHGVRRRSYWGADGQKLGEGRARFDLEEATSPVVPATNATQLAVVVTILTDGSRPTESDIHTERVPIVAWRITPDGAVPVFAVDALCENSTYLIVMPDGTFSSPVNETFANLDDAWNAALDDAQREWDELNQPAA